MDKLSIAQEIEIELIKIALLNNNWVQRKAAQDLRMPKSTLFDYINKFDIMVGCSTIDSCLSRIEILTRDMAYKPQLEVANG